MKKLLSILIFGLLYLSSVASSNEEIIKVFYSGFSFSNTYDSISSHTKYTSDLIKEKNSETGIDIISSSLLKSVKNSQFTKIDLDTTNLLDFDKYPDNAIVMSVVLQHEEFTQEYNSATNKYSGFYDAYFEILFYDFSDKNLIAAIPFDFEIRMLTENKLSKKQIVKLIKDFYLKNKPFNNLNRKINKYIF